ncbi:MAG: alpha/beta fold hydrolase [Solirubrobacteraceae bacterium]
MASVGGEAAEFVQTSDGRTLAYVQLGVPDGKPVFVLHGTPGSRLSGRHPDPARVADAGLRVITYDRPGYGRSTRHPGRDVVDCVADVAAIAGALGIERFFVTGGSGGGPHALAVAARLPERVIRAACNVSSAPYDAPDLDWFDGMDPENVKELGWALEGEETLVRELEQEADKQLSQVDEDPAALLGDFQLSEADQKVLRDQLVRERMVKSFREALASGVWGWVDDDLACVKPWGFEVEEIRVPVQVRYGVADVLVPAGHGKWLARHVQNANVIIDREAGHLSTPDEHLERLRSLVAD